MKIDKKTRDSMKLELLAVFKLCDKLAKGNALLDFIEGSPFVKIGYWIKAHNWSNVTNSNASPEAIEFFSSIKQNPDHELYPCDSNDDSLKTALKAISKELSESGIKWDTSTNAVESMA